MNPTRITDEKILEALIGCKQPASFENIAAYLGCVNSTNNGNCKYTSDALKIIPILRDLIERKLVNPIKTFDAENFYATREIRYAASKKGQDVLKEFNYIFS
ncbi:MAG: hypothetical protein ABIF85_05710 [Nanoarchaeota archaeon]|nr:hypothetical protein [Nanoarchaeota archaeon]MBU4452207.1 hypothetical protein [Nanoarchaeota archaeon]MCG2723593.1 hypothetical protein [archaeon]